MAHEHIARLKAENVAMSALLKRATGEKLDADEAEYIAELAKSRALESRLRQKYDLGGAIEKALSGAGSSGPQLPPQEGDINKTVGGDNLETAIVKAFAGTKTRYESHSAGHMLTEEVEKQRARQEAIAKAAPDTRSKVRRDIESPGPRGAK